MIIPTMATLTTRHKTHTHRHTFNFILVRWWITSPSWSLMISHVILFFDWVGGVLRYPLGQVVKGEYVLQHTHSLVGRAVAVIGSVGILLEEVVLS